jgi:hypothetical protein
MESALIKALGDAAEAPGFATFAIVAGLMLYIAFNRKIIVPGEVAKLEARLAGVVAGEAACQVRCADLEKRIAALEAQLGDHK